MANEQLKLIRKIKKTVLYTGEFNVSFEVDATQRYIKVLETIGDEIGFGYYVYGVKNCLSKTAIENCNTEELTLICRLAELKLVELKLCNAEKKIKLHSDAYMEAQRLKAKEWRVINRNKHNDYNKYWRASNKDYYKQQYYIQKNKEKETILANLNN